MLALGLENRIVGIACTYDEYPAEYAAAAASHPDLRGSESLTKEPLLNARPDFVLSAWPTFDFDAAEGAATRADVATIGADVYGFSTNCTDKESASSLDLLDEDVRNLGTIFGLSDRAQVLVAKISGRIAAVEQTVGSADPVSVLAYANGEGPLGVVGTGFGNQLITAAGVTNVFGDADTSFLRVAVEKAVAAAPQVLVVNTYSPGPTTQEKVALLEQVLPTVPAAVKHRNVAVRDIEQTIPLRWPRLSRPRDAPPQPEHV